MAEAAAPDGFVTVLFELCLLGFRLQGVWSEWSYNFHVSCIVVSVVKVWNMVLADMRLIVGAGFDYGQLWFGLRISIIGCRSNLPITLQKRIELTEETTKADGLHLVIALNYGGHYDILQATKSIASKVMNGSLQLEDINKNLFDQEFESKCLSIANPDLLTRTGGEQRVSNFLLWQLAYSEYYFTKTLFADFGEEDLEEAICNFQRRHRRFGGHKY
ncbi:dimethylallylcistransferase CPT1, chloroplastic-like [Nicotiana tomentosiformis]|uniref:dimethylallylcistransferase CPT1, chloroplastic-like n=1 Tax=Nicotiana tomentosiformis TaxID=4098 RepID=UPI00388CA33F